MEAALISPERRHGSQSARDTSSSEAQQQVKEQGAVAGIPLFLQVSASAPPLFIQRKLSIGQRGDAYEREADDIADQIVSGPSTLLQRKCACGGSDGECETCKRGEATVQRRATGGIAPSTVPAVVHEVVGSPGQPIEHSTRNAMEQRFGHDLSAVRLHTDARAGESASAVNAVAYTVGRDVVFAPGRYVPTSTEGRRLLAHELTHVVQQGEGGNPSRRIVGPVEHKHERAAPVTAQSPLVTSANGQNEIQIQRMVAGEDTAVDTEGQSMQSTHPECGPEPISCSICFDSDPKPTEPAWTQNCKDPLNSKGSLIYVTSKGVCHRRLDAEDFKYIWDKNCPGDWDPNKVPGGTKEPKFPNVKNKRQNLTGGGR